MKKWSTTFRLQNYVGLQFFFKYFLLVTKLMLYSKIFFDIYNRTENLCLCFMLIQCTITIYALTPKI